MGAPGRAADNCTVDSLARWEPLLSPEVREQVLANVRRIAAEFRGGFLERFSRRDLSSSPEAGTLGNGAAGVALLYGYLAEIDGDRQCHETSQELIAVAGEAVSESTIGPSFLDGIVGVAWAVAHLARRLGDSSDEPFAEVDSALSAVLKRSSWIGGFDLAAGLVGVGVYLRERVSSRRVRRAIDDVVIHLNAQATIVDEGVCWSSRAPQLTGAKDTHPVDVYYDLGMAHGSAGAVALLARLYSEGASHDLVDPLLGAATSWMLSKRMHGDHGSVFPAWYVPGRELVPTRSAWCYGDPGIAVALLLASEAKRNTVWRAEAERIGRIAAQRPMGDTGASETSICHGAAGLALIYHRLFAYTRAETFRAAALTWLRPVLERCTQVSTEPGAHLSGLRRSSSLGFLNGIAGECLVLLAAASPVEPEWDRALLLS